MFWAGSNLRCLLGTRTARRLGGGHAPLSGWVPEGREGGLWVGVCAPFLDLAFSP
jgi:hypothetical protein